MDKKLLKAEDCNCVICGKKAVCFYPVIDPDIPSEPYCRRCVDKIKIRLLEKILKLSKEEAKAPHNKEKKKSET